MMQLLICFYLLFSGIILSMDSQHLPMSLRVKKIEGAHCEKELLAEMEESIDLQSHLVEVTEYLLSQTNTSEQKQHVLKTMLLEDILLLIDGDKELQSLYEVQERLLDFEDATLISFFRKPQNRALLHLYEDECDYNHIIMLLKEEETIDAQQSPIEDSPIQPVALREGDFLKSDSFATSSPSIKDPKKLATAKRSSGVINSIARPPDYASLDSEIHPSLDYRDIRREISWSRIPVDVIVIAEFEANQSTPVSAEAKLSKEKDSELQEKTVAQARSWALERFEVTRDIEMERQTPTDMAPVPVGQHSTIKQAPHTKTITSEQRDRLLAHRLQAKRLNKAFGISEHECEALQKTYHIPLEIDYSLCYTTAQEEELKKAHKIHGDVLRLLKEYSQFEAQTILEPCAVRAFELIRLHQLGLAEAFYQTLSEQMSSVRDFSKGVAATGADEAVSMVKSLPGTLALKYGAPLLGKFFLPVALGTALYGFYQDGEAFQRDAIDLINARNSEELGLAASRFVSNSIKLVAGGECITALARQVTKCLQDIFKTHGKEGLEASIANIKEGITYQARQSKALQDSASQREKLVGTYGETAVKLAEDSFNAKARRAVNYSKELEDRVKIAKKIEQNPDYKKYLDPEKPHSIKSFYEAASMFSALEQKLVKGPFARPRIEAKRDMSHEADFIQAEGVGKVQWNVKRGLSHDIMGRTNWNAQLFIQNIKDELAKRQRVLVDRTELTDADYSDLVAGLKVTLQPHELANIVIVHRYDTSKSCSSLKKS